jgi:hypothetical protein
MVKVPSKVVLNCHDPVSIEIRNTQKGAKPYPAVLLLTGLFGAWRNVKPMVVTAAETEVYQILVMRDTA